jgi:hypothetical protein
MNQELSDPGEKKRFSDQSVTRINNLKRREIQAPVIVNLLAGFIREIGYKRAMQVASAAIQSDALTAGRTMALSFGGNSIQVLLRIVREVWAEDDALEFTVLEVSDQTLSFNVTRCQYA